MTALRRTLLASVLLLVASCRGGCGRSVADVGLEPRDDLRTAASLFRADLAHATDPGARKNLARAIVARSDREDVSFERHGDAYRHYEVPEPPYGCLAAGTCFRDYLAFENRAYEAELALPAPSPDVDARVERLASQLDLSSITRELAARVELVADALPRLSDTAFRGPANAKTTIYVIATGHPTELRREATITRILRELPDVRVGEIQRAAHPRLFASLGRRLPAAAFHGRRLLIDFVTYEQWLELLAPAGPFPEPMRRHPELKIFDAHEHVMDRGPERLRTFLVDERFAGAILAALPESVDGRGIDAQNARVLAAASGAPPTFVPFVTLDERGPDPLADMQRMLASGAKGLKLITGHDDHHAARGRGPIDPPALRRVFAELEQRAVPVLWHVNTHIYSAGFLRVLEDFPKLTVVCPHLGGYLTYAPSIVRKLLERYPNLYFDFSFGAQPMYLRRAFEDLSLRHREWRALLIDHPDRFLFGVDMVVTPATTRAHARMLFQLYVSMLERETFDLHFFPAAGAASLVDQSHNHDGLHGLALPVDVLQKVYFDNAAKIYGVK